MNVMSGIEMGWADLHVQVVPPLQGGEIICDVYLGLRAGRSTLL